MENHKCGFVNIIGKPNVGKSTLMNALVGEKLSIITSKSQTTRHRITGILNGEDFQIVYSDTPGIILNPAYKLQESMNNFVSGSLQDADIILFITDIFEQSEDEPEDTLRKLKHIESPKILLINKIDIDKEETLDKLVDYWKAKDIFDHVIPISALHKTNIDILFGLILNNLPLHPPFYPKDELTDKPERFFMSEIIREKIFLNYKKEIPYSCEVEIEEFKEDEDIIRIRALIYVERKTQKGIIIGNQGAAIKKMATQARKDMEIFLAKKVFLETFVKIREKWRSNDRDLKNFGYNH